MNDLQVHTSLSAGVTKQSLALDYGPALRDHIVAPLFYKGIDGVDKAVANMQDYSLMREDLDRLVALTHWPQNTDLFKMVNSKTKGAFTRKLNKGAARLPYSIKAREGKGRTVDFMMLEEDMGIEEYDHHDDIEKDTMIKIKKPSSKKLASMEKKEDRKEN